MRSGGVVVHHETVERAAVAWRTALRSFEVLRLLKWARNHFQDTPPDLLICIDSFAMNRHFAKVARRFNIPVLYYIPPQLWASRAGRIKHLRRVVNKVACILPFEEAYLRERGVDATFVGHPLLDDFPRSAASYSPFNEIHRPPTVGLLAGSRMGKARGNFPGMLKIAGRIRADFPDAVFLAPTTPATHAIVSELGANYPNLEVGLDQINAFTPRCDLCIVKSGTSTLHVAAHGVPMIIVYRASPLIWHGLGRWVIKTRTFGLVNLLALSKEHIAPSLSRGLGRLTR